MTDYLKKLDMSSEQRWADRWELLRTVLTGRRFRKISITFKKNQKPLDNQELQMKPVEYYWFKYQLAKKVISLRALYIEYAESPVPDEPYIYFAAPYQPEVISNLLSGVYEDPFLVIDLIASVIPGDWRIYYKEHPNTFKEADKVSLERSADYFAKLKAHPKVKIVSFETDTFTLIDESRAICTVGGAVGWEAIIREKPAMVFGSLWYQACHSVFTIETLEDAINAVERILEGYVPNREDVNRYAQAIFNVCEQDLVFPDHQDNNLGIRQCADPKAEMLRMAEVFHKTYVTHYEK